MCPCFYQFPFTPSLFSPPDPNSGRVLPALLHPSGPGRGAGARGVQDARRTRPQDHRLPEGLPYQPAGTSLRRFYQEDCAQSHQ